MFAIFRPHPNDDLARIGEAHLKHDLSPDDRARLRTAASKVTNYTTLGSLLGLGLGAAVAYRIHANRVALYNAFKMVNRPIEVIFPNGRREPIPNIDRYLKPTFLSDAATYLAFGMFGSFFGGEMGLIAGSASASRAITSDPASQRRIEDAFRKFQIDILQRQVKKLESGIDKSSTTVADTDSDSTDGEQSSWEKLRNQAAGLANNLRD
ncbi:hypothetical protein QBC39DRAFT_251263 [Podospora conica]|nr:hypothetical protein QBC39DRAFT_251263 [Schizothecium conicum]